MSFSMMNAMGDYMAEKPREIVKIDLADILDDENNDFEVEGGTDIEIKNALLKDSIEQFGLLDPLTVRPAGGGKYRLISGHRRKLAHERLVAEGKTEFRKVDCIIRESDETDAEQMLIEANIPNRVVSDWEKLQAVNRMNAIFEKRQQEGQKIPGRRREHIAAALGMSVSAVGRLEKIEKNLTQEYKDELKAGNIGVSVADKIASRPQEEQKDLHAEKGAKVKLVDLQQEKQLPVETRSRVPGIPADRGEIILIIGEYDGQFYAGICGRVYFPDMPPHAFEYIDKQQKYISREAAVDGAMEMIGRDAFASDLLKLRDAEQKEPPKAEPVERRRERRDASGRGRLLLIGSLNEAWRRLAAIHDAEDEAALQYATNRLNMIIREIEAED
nr:MAG TPA: chromosome partitioning protein [Caudoviricetes sp.]